MTGVMSINGTPGGGPMRMGTPIVDIGTGLIACNAILAALVERGRSGLGQAIEVPLFDSAISMLHPQAANSLMSGTVPVSTGNGHPNIAPYDMYQTRTKPIYLAVGNNGQFAKLCEYVGLSDLPTDPRFIDNEDRLKNREALTEAIKERLAETNAEDLEPALLAVGVPAGVVRNVKEALEHPHTKHRNMVVSVGSYRGTGIPARLSRTPGSVRKAPPKFGEDTVSVLAEVGYQEIEIERLSLEGIVKKLRD
jgi:crotonobetainyl-CoA:carnitine CoA-transferase CaiB-like acyl-CoA transferase